MIKDYSIILTNLKAEIANDFRTLVKENGEHCLSGEYIYHPKKEEAINGKILKSITLRKPDDVVFHYGNGYFSYWNVSVDELIRLLESLQVTDKDAPLTDSAMSPDESKDNSLEDYFNELLLKKRAKEETKKEKNERLDNECMAFTSEQADRFINEFSFLGKYGFTFKKRLTRENNYYYNYGRMAYSVVILDKREALFEIIHFVKGSKSEMVFLSHSQPDLEYHQWSFKEFAKKLTEWFNFS